MSSCTKTVLLIATILLSLRVAHSTQSPCEYPPEGCFDQPGFEACTSISGRNGWGVMDNDGDQHDKFACTASGETANRGNSIINSTASVGNQSWHFKRGAANHDGRTKTACSPKFAVNRSSFKEGRFTYSVDFKSANTTCTDGSHIRIMPATCECDNGANEYMEIYNSPNGTRLRICTLHDERVGFDIADHYDMVRENREYGYGNEEEGICQLYGFFIEPSVVIECDKWHTLSCTMIEQVHTNGTGTVNTTCTMDGVVFLTGRPFFTIMRNFYSDVFEPSCRVKFEPIHDNHYSDNVGFLFDNFYSERQDQNGVVMSYSTGFEDTAYETGTRCRLVPESGCDTAVCSAAEGWVSENCSENNRSALTCGTLKTVYKDNDCCRSGTENNIVTLQNGLAGEGYGYGE